MKRINSLVQKLASIAPKAASLAVVVVGSFVSSPMAFAGCSFSPSAVTVYASPGEPVSSGFTISGISETWLSEGNVTAGLWYTPGFTNPQVHYNSPPDTIYPQSPLQKFSLPSSSTGYLSVDVPPYPTATVGQSVVVQTTVKDWFSTCDATLTVIVVAPKGPPCSQTVTAMYSGYTGSPVTATLVAGSTNWCLINFPVPAGATPFIWNNAYYVAPDTSTTCLAGGPTPDGANHCYFEPQPYGGFQVNDSFYVPGSSPLYCTALNSTYTYDGNVKACLVKTAPWGTHAFVSGPNWYFTTEFKCKAGGYDGANCYIMTAPAVTTAFINSNAFYYLY
jgi:hypothetical protein